LPTIRHRCNFDVWALAQGRGVGHRSLVTTEKLLSKYNEDLIFFNLISRDWDLISINFTCKKTKDCVSLTTVLF